MKIDMAEPIVEEQSIPPKLPRLRSWLCALRLHHRTRWSEPYERDVAVSAFMMIPGSRIRHYMQYRECVGCGERDERVIISG